MAMFNALVDEASDKVHFDFLSHLAEKLDLTHEAALERLGDWLLHSAEMKLRTREY